MHVCFVALNSYNLFSSSRSVKHIGGAEMQQFLMARWLVEQGHRVTVITRDHGQPQGEVIDGIRIVKAYDVDRGLPIVRFLFPRWKRLVDAMRIADADLYYQRGAGVETGQVAWWCRINGKPFVYASASESDCSESLPFLGTRRDKLLYRKGLRLASAIVVQTKRQAELLKSAYDRDGVVIYSSGRDLGQPSSPAEKSNCVIWLGRYSPQKRFEWLLDIAERSRSYEFLIVGGSNDGSAYARAMVDRASALPNVNLVGHVPKDEVVSYYNRAKFLLLTSPLEGFPNVFLEAWQLGIPVITSFDPDGIVEANRLGWRVESPQQAVDLLRRYEDDSSELHAMASAVRNYFVDNHTAGKNMPRYLALFRELLAENSATN